MGKVRLVMVASITVLLVLALLSFDSGTFLKVALAADSYGNDINFVEVWEDSTLKANFTSSGGTVRVNASKQIKFVVSIKFNSSLADSNQEAIDFTKVLMNITGIWTNEELNNTSCQLSGDFYWLKEEGILAGGTLTDGQTYDCEVLYQGYY